MFIVMRVLRFHACMIFGWLLILSDRRLLLPVLFDSIFIRSLGLFLMRGVQQCLDVVLVFIPHPRCIVQRSFVHACVMAFAFCLPVGCNAIRMSDEIFQCMSASNTDVGTQ